MLLLSAFNIKKFQLSNAPGWTDSERYDIDAKFDPAIERPRSLSPDELPTLIKALLESRFQLKSHREAKQMPVLSLVVTKNGSNLHPHSGPPKHPTDWGKDHINALEVTIAEFGRVLETQLDHVVVDDTHIPGTFDFALKWTPDTAQESDASGASIFTALREQYGLELKARKGPVEIVVIDQIERPSRN